MEGWYPDLNTLIYATKSHSTDLLSKTSNPKAKPSPHPGCQQSSYRRPKFRVPTAVKPVAACPVPTAAAGPVWVAAGALAALTDCAATGPVLAGAGATAAPTDCAATGALVGARAGATTGAAEALLLPATTDSRPISSLRLQLLAR